MTDSTSGPNTEKCFGGVTWFLGNWNGTSTNSNALSSSYFAAYYFSYDGGLLNDDDLDVARDVLLGILPCN